MKTDQWFVYGAGGFGFETMDILNAVLARQNAEKYHRAFVIDDRKIDEIQGYPVLSLEECRDGNIIIAVGEPVTRVKMLIRVRSSSLRLKSLIAPSAVVSSSAEIVDGVVIAPLCSIQARAKIEENAAINTMAIVGHDVTVKASAVISSMVNLGGSVTVGEESYIGMGAMIKEGVKIGSNTIIGMGSVVYKDVPDGVIALGNPARVARKNEDRKVFK
ncbi:MAG: NeuD/PglB/VioB family sugar acetyltransferase [Gammaproteobacteria bacterium]